MNIKEIEKNIDAYQQIMNGVSPELLDSYVELVKIMTFHREKYGSDYWNYFPWYKTGKIIDKIIVLHKKVSSIL
jgi:hypothetical protein